MTRLAPQTCVMAAEFRVCQRRWNCTQGLLRVGTLLSSPQAGLLTLDFKLCESKTRKVQESVCSSAAVKKQLRWQHIRLNASTIVHAEALMLFQPNNFISVPDADLYQAA